MISKATDRQVTALSTISICPHHNSSWPKKAHAQTGKRGAFPKDFWIQVSKTRYKIIQSFIVLMYSFSWKGLGLLDRGVGKFVCHAGVFFFWFMVEVNFCFVLFCLVCFYIKIFAKVWARSRIQNLHLIPAVSRPAKCQKNQNIILERPFQSVKVLTVILTLDCWGLIPPTFLTNRIFQCCLSFSLSFPVLDHFCYDTGVQISVLYGFANRHCNQQDLVCLNWVLLFWVKWAWTDHKEFTSWRLPGLVPRCAFMQYRVHYKPKEFSQIPVFCGIRLCSERNFKYFSLIVSPQY